MTSPPAWQCQCSVDADVSVSFAWQYMTNVSNWSDPPAEFALDGPFAPGSRGTTRMPEQQAIPWVIGEVDAGRGYTIESGASFTGALMLVQWQFDALSPGRTRLTQRIELRGENAGEYAAGVRAAFEPNLEPGMRNIAERMARAASGT